MIEEFKKFAMKGNVVDLALAVVIGGAFGKIVTSLVGDIIMPPIGLLLGGVDFSNLVATLKAEELALNGEVIPAVTINYGMFLNTMIDFLIIAGAMFVVVKFINSLKKEEEPKKEEVKGPTEIELLTEIRDSLKR
jgi:large conductance mechanosensitive channel